MTFSNVSTYNATAPSLNIKQDFLVSFASLAKIDSKLQTCNNGDDKLNKYLPKLTTIIQSFNSHIAHINHQIEPMNFAQFGSYEEYCADLTFDSDEDSNTIYNEQKSLFESEQLKEADQLQQLGALSKTLGQTITSVFDKLSKFDSIASQLPNIKLEEANLTACLLKPKLTFVEKKSAETTAVETTSTTSTTTDSLSASMTISKTGDTEAADLSSSISMLSSFTTSDSGTTTTVETPVETPVEVAEIVDETPKTATHVGVTVVCDLSDEQTLAICCEPTWGEAPIAFVKNEAGWVGQAPVGKEWKCVVIQDGNVVKWENENNRRCEADSEALTLNVRFG